MPRLYHSPSSIDLGRRCRRAWFYRYVQGIRKPEIEWREDLKGRDRSLALGKALHATLEAHFTPGGKPNWLWFPGQVAASGAGLLPPPAEHAFAPVVEAGIGSLGTGVSIGPGHDGRERFTVTIAGVPWLGYRDLTHHEAPRGAPTLYDYKSTKSIERYAKSAAELLQDLQANLYAYDTMTELGADELLCRWVYFETDRVRRAEPRDFVVKRAEAFSVIECAAEVAKELDAIDQIDQAPMNVSACAEYGGCEFHEKAGGPCRADVPVGAQIQARVKKALPLMPLNPASRANLAARFPTPTSVETTPTPAPVVTHQIDAAEQPAPVVVASTSAEPVTPVRPAGRRPKAPAGTDALSAAMGAVSEAQAAHAATLEALEAAKENLRKALA